MRFVLGCLLCLLPLPAQDHTDFLQISDTHVANYDGVSASLALQRVQNAFTRSTFSAFLAGIREQPPAFVLHTGDAIDAVCFEGAAGSDVCGQIPLFQAAAAKSPVPIYLALGNHDTERYILSGTPPKAAGDHSISAAARRQWRAALPTFQEGTYYAFTRSAGKTSFRFLVLDNGEPGTAGSEYGRQQLAWLNQQIASAREWVILAFHIPLAADDFSKAVKAAAARNSRVILALAGHRHTNAVEEIDLGARKLLQVRTASLALNPSSYRRFRLRPDRIEIFDPGETNTIARVLELVQ
ncbi:MAG: metallophosphoesterase [Acidobacteria bacterium]|nr:metallophosphoesterase [Acidobacteriota bacterium]